MITGAHAIIFSKDPEADRAFLRDVIAFPYVDAGGGWLIFGLPPAEVAVHPADGGGRHQLFLMCDDINDFNARMQQHSVPCSEIHEESWGLVTEITLPGGGMLGVYQPRHDRPPAP